MSGNKNKFRIVFITHWARHLGGAEYSLIDIVGAVAREGAEVHLVTSEDGALVEKLRMKGVISRVVSCEPNLLNVKRGNLPRSLVSQWRSTVAFFGFVLKVHNHIRTLQPDLIHANVPKSHITLLLMRFLGYRGDAVIHMREIFPQQGAAYRLYRTLFRNTRTRVIAISEAVRDALPPEIRRNTTVLYNGVVIPREYSEPAISYPIRFLYLGRIVPWKGCHLLIDAFSRLRSLVAPDMATLTLTGPTIYWDTEYRRQLTGMVRQYGLQGSVFIHDETGKPLEVLREHHVLCMASHAEPFGRVAVEAQSCGLPVIGFASGGLPEVVKHNETGLLVNEGDCDALTSAMELMVADSRRIIAMGRSGRERICRLFDFDNQRGKFIDFLLSKTE